MEILWFVIITIVLCVFFVLDGYDFGAGIIHLFFAKSESDKKVIAKSAGLFWDSNEVWLVAAGGMLFMAFPTFYASVFSGFYLPLIMVLWLIIFRAIGLELRGQFNYQMWNDIWDKAFGISSLLLALFFGIALGNLIRGVNLGGVENGTSLYEAQYFFLPLWNASFSPNEIHPGVIDWFTIIIGIIAVVVLAIHGANWVILKTNSSINEKLKAVIPRMNLLLLVLIIVSVIVWGKVHPKPYSTFGEYPYLLVLPMLFFLGHVGLFFTKRWTNRLNFFLSSMTIAGGISSTLTSMFPVVLPSTNSVNESLTIYNTTTTEYGLSVATGWVVVGITLIIVYLIVQKRLTAGKIDNMDYGH